MRWARHDVRLHRTARQRLGNRVVGDIELTGDALDLAGDGLTLIAYSAEPGSQAEDQLKLLATWSATAHTPASEAAATNQPSEVGPVSAPAGNRAQGCRLQDRQTAEPGTAEYMKRLLVPSAALLWGLQIAFLSPALALILVTLYDASTAQVGWILTVYNASGFVASLLVPSYADRREDYLRPMLACGVLTLILALVLAIHDLAASRRCRPGRGGRSRRRRQLDALRPPQTLRRQTGRHRQYPRHRFRRLDRRPAGCHADHGRLRQPRHSPRHRRPSPFSTSPPQPS